MHKLSTGIVKNAIWILLIAILCFQGVATFVSNNTLINKVSKLETQVKKSQTKSEAAIKADKESKAEIKDVSKELKQINDLKTNTDSQNKKIQELETKLNKIDSNLGDF